MTTFDRELLLSIIEILEEARTKLRGVLTSAEPVETSADAEREAVAVPTDAQAEDTKP